LLVLVVVLIAGAATAGTDDDCAPGDRSCLLDEQARTYGEIGVGSTLEEVRAALGDPEETSGGYAPAGKLPAQVGVPNAISYPKPGPPRRTIPPVHRYDDLALLVFEDRVFSFMVTAEKAETTRGVGVGDSLEQARTAFPRIRCQEVAAGEAILPFQKDSSYTSCRATLAPKRFVWFGDDPIRSITIADYSG
jgi:hypothetical protein